MLKLSAISKRIQQKSSIAFEHLTKKLINRFQAESLVQQHARELTKSYVHGEVPQIQDYAERNRQISEHRTHQRVNSSLNALPYDHKIRSISKNTSLKNRISQKEMRIKRQKLMVQLKEIDQSIKKNKQEQHLQKIQKNRTESECDTQIYEKATQLVEKMNKQRKQIMQKKVKEALTLKHTVQESIKQFKEMQELKKQERLKRKIQIQRRIEARKHKFNQMEKLNKMSNKVIKQLNSYKIGLPDIYFKKPQTQKEDSVNEVMLTNIEHENQSNIANGQLDHVLHSQSRVSPFLQNLLQEEIQRKRQAQKLKQYQRQIREKQIEYGKKLRLNLKSKERRLSQSKLE